MLKNLCLDPRAATPLIVLFSALLAFGPLGCTKRKKDGCEKDTDCKADRVCVSGTCEEPIRKEPPSTRAGQQGSPAPAQPAQNPNAMAADGLPVVIPPPGSPPPSTQEWDAVTKEVTVKGSSNLNCETKMLREWLRVNCKPFGKNSPTSVQKDHEEGQQAYVYSNAGVVTSTVVQVVRGKSYRGSYFWMAGATAWGEVLNVSWPAGADRPSFFFSQM